MGKELLYSIDELCHDGTPQFLQVVGGNGVFVYPSHDDEFLILSGETVVLREGNLFTRDGLPIFLEPHLKVFSIAE